MSDEHLQLDADASQVTKDESMPTVMIVGDSAGVHSGFAQVVRNVFKRIWPRRKWNIIQFGWWHTTPVEKVPWDIIITDRNPANPAMVDQNDRYGQRSFEECVQSVKPDLLWIIGDPWMIGPALLNSYRPNCKAIVYMPVDGAPMALSWDILKHADTIVPYLPWGKKMMERWVPQANIVDFIPHGVDTNVYKPADEATRNRVREGHGVGPNGTLMVSVSRNQLRKNLPALIELTYYIRSGDYMVCPGCGRAYRNPYDYHMGKPSGRKGVCHNSECIEQNTTGVSMIGGKPNLDFTYYIHTPIIDLEDQSWKLLDVLDTFGLGAPVDGDPTDMRYPGFRWNESMRIVHGISEDKLAELYSAADIFALPTTGEGFGLPILEAMSCGTPVVVPNISSHPDFVKEGGGMLVDIAYHICEPMSQYYRGYADLDDYLTKLLLLVNDKNLKAQMGKAAREVAMRYDWDDIAERWEELIDNELKGFSPSPDWTRLTMV